MKKNMLLLSTILFFLNCGNFRVSSLPEKTVENTLEINGVAQGENASVEINSANVKIEQKRFSYKLPLKLGDNKISIIYKDKGKTENKDFLVKRITKEELENEKTQKNCEMNLASAVKVEKTNWSKGGFGSVAEHNVLIFNPCKFKIKDIEFDAEYYSNSDTRIDSTSRTVYEVINPNSRKWLNFSGLVHSQASSSSVTISSVKKIE